MKKIISVILAVVMVFSIGSVAAFAAETYEVIFTEFPYELSPFRSDYVGKYMGYEYGVDYWFTITNKDGTTTDIKGYPYSVEVEAGDSLEFTVSVAAYIEPGSVKMLAYPTGTSAETLYNPITGEPYEQYHIADSIANTFGLKPTQDMTVCVSEYHMFNDAFLYDFPSSEYYTANRLFLTSPEAVNPWDMYSYAEWNNTQVIYVNETLFFEVRIPLDNKYDYHYETYHVYYTVGDDLVGDLTGEKVYLKRPASEKDGTPEIDERIAHYETDTEWVDIYAIPNVESKTQVKVANTVTYTLDMLAQFFEDFSLDNLDSIDLSTVDLGPMVEFILRILNLIVKILNGFGLNIDISSLLG